jgi:hypothetical protein
MDIKEKARKISVLRASRLVLALDSLSGRQDSVKRVILLYSSKLRFKASVCSSLCSQFFEELVYGLKIAKLAKINQI